MDDVELYADMRRILAERLVRYRLATSLTCRRYHRQFIVIWIGMMRAGKDAR